MDLLATPVAIVLTIPVDVTLSPPGSLRRNSAKNLGVTLSFFVAPLLRMTGREFC